MACCHATRTGRADLLKSIETRSVVILVGLEITFISMYLLELIELYSYSKGYWALLDFFLLQLIYLAYFANDQRKTMAVLYAVLAVVVFAGFASTCAVAVLVEYQNFLIELKIFFNFVSLVLAGMLALVFFYPQETWYSQRFRENLKDNEAMSEYTIVDTDREKPGASSEAVNFYYLFGCSWIMAILVFFASLHSMYIAYLAYSYNVPDSEFVTVQGMSIRFNCGGTGSPTVVLLHGLGGRSLDYSWLQPELEKETRVCSYDRPGYGDSFQRGPLPRTAERSAVELEGILTELEITGDFIVVAHSFGTWVTREYDAKFPGRIQGALFLDPVNENNYPDCDPNVAYLPPDYLTPMFLAALFLSDSGVIELIDWSGILDGSWDVDLLPPDARARYIKPDSLFYRTALDEYRSFGKSCDSLRKKSAALRKLDFPLFVVGAEDGIHDDFQFLQQISDLSPNGTLEIAPGATHAQLVLSEKFQPRNVNLTLALIENYIANNP